MVWVLPGMLPAIIKVAPNSPRALAKDSIAPEATPGQAKGRVIVQKILHSETPKVLAASKILESIISKAPLVVLYISGNDTTVAAITVAGHEKITFMLIRFKSFPMGLFIPNINRRKNPKTVGGSTIGIVNRASKMPLYFLFLWLMKYAAKIPRKKVITVDTNEVLMETTNGDKSEVKRYHSYQSSHVKPYFL